MKAELRRLFDDRILDTAAERFGLDPTSLNRLDSFENVVLEASRDGLPLILKRREILLYVAIHRGFNEADFDEWCRRYLDGRRERIRDQVPYLDLDWSKSDLAGC